MRKLRSALIAGTVFGLVLVAFWSLAGALHSELVQQQRAHVRDQLLVFRAELANAINTHLQMLAPVADRLSAGLPADAQITALVERVPGLEALLLVRNGETRVLYPLAESYVSAADRPTERLLAKLAAANRGGVDTAISEPAVGQGGSRAFVARAARRGGEYWGSVAIEWRAAAVLVEMGAFELFTDIEVALRESGADAPLLIGHPRVFGPEAELTTLRIADRAWELAARPRSGWGSRDATVVRVRNAGVVVATLLSIALWIVLWHGRQPAWFGPALVAASIVGLCGALAWLVKERGYELDRQTLLRSTTSMHHALRLRLDAHARMLSSLAVAPRDEQALASAVEAARVYRRSNPEIESIFVTDTSGTPVARLAGDVPSRAAPATALSALDSAARTRRPAYTAPFGVSPDEASLQIWVAWSGATRLEAFVVMQLSAGNLLHNTAAPEKLQDYAVYFVNTRGTVLAGRMTNRALHATLQHQMATTPPGHDTAIRLHAYEQPLIDWGTLLLTVLAAGLTVGLFWAMWHLQRANLHLESGVASRTRRLREANDRLNRDIAERKRVEAALRESETRFRGVFEQSNDAIFLIDAQLDCIVDANPVAAQLLEYSHEELHRTPVSAIHPHEMALFRRFSEEVRNSGAAYSDEMSCRTKTGASVPVELSASNLQLGAQRLLLVMARDLTERKRTEAHLNEALVQVGELKDKLQAENVYLRDEIRIQHNFEEIIGESRALKAVLKRIEDVAPTDASVLVLGETGTGKELVARAVHNLSGRRQHSLVRVNCAALPHNLIESELFGHERGAFTGATARKVGRFELADAGTIFLDEVGDLPMPLQAKLLRVLQEGEFERVGATRSIGVDARVIAATNRDLSKSVQAGEFREDLYYRLNVFPIHCPALRDRSEDIPTLVKHFVGKYSARSGKRITTIAKPVLDELCAYPWPGNVRELENILERAVILSSGPGLVLDEQLHLEPVAAGEQPCTLKQMEMVMILDALRASNWVIEGKRGAANRLDIPPSTLRERMQRAGIKRPNV